MAARAREQREWRRQNAAVVARKLAKRLRSEEHQTRMHGSNRLFPLGSLKKDSLRGIFGGWIPQVAQSRLFTKALCRVICGMLRDKFGMGPTPDDEPKRLKALLSLARKRGLKIERAKPSRPQRQKQMTHIDLMDTLPMEMEEACQEELVFVKS